MACFFCSDEYKNYYQFITELEECIVLLNNEQTYEGRCALVTKKHATELFELDPQVLSTYMAEVAQVARAVKAIFKADKINYYICGDIDQHLHMHIVPKHKGGSEWGQAFLMSGREVFLSEEKYSRLVEKIRAALSTT